MIIGCDIDNVISNYFEYLWNCLFSKYPEKLQGFDRYSIDAWSVEDWRTPLTSEEIYKVIYSIDLSRLDILPGAKDFLRRRIKNVFFISSRELWYPNTFPITFAWLQRTLGYPVLPNHLLQIDSYDKTEIIKRLDCDFYFEDNPSTATNVAKMGTKVLLFDYPWNRNVKETKNLIRIKPPYWQNVAQIWQELF